MPDTPDAPHMTEYPLGHDDYEDNADTLMGVLLRHAPTSTEQAACTAWYNQMQQGSDPALGKYLEQAVCMALADGLRWGNWPWVSGFPSVGKPSTT
jgi:hypothetical protein